MKYYFFVLLAICCFQQNFLYAQTQEQRCGHVKLPSYFSEKAMQELLAKKQQQQTATRTEGSKYIIPVVFHVCFQQGGSNLTNKVTAAQIQSQIDVLNEDYNRKNADTTRTKAQFRNVAANANIEFRLAILDTLGNKMAEKGIMRYNIYQPEWNDADFDNQVKTRTIWNPKKYLNIWVVDRITYGGVSALGYAQFPDLSTLTGLQTSYGIERTDGIVVAARALGSIAKEPSLTSSLSPRFAYGRTLSHEIGHFLGLLHTFHEDGQGSCDFDADFCADTPLILNKTFGCPAEKNTCGVLAMTENFLDYTDDFCMNTFTKNQVSRMQVVLENSPRRKELLTSTVTSSENESLTTQILLFPNPANDFVLIQAKGEDIILQKITLFSMLGQEVAQPQIDLPNTEIWLDKFPKGMYVVQIETNRGVLRQKLVVN
jgi:zinc-dependent metalloproteinase lipoprotein